MATVTGSDEATKAAWDDYAERLQGLEGAEYEHAEAEAWAELQSALAERRDALSLSDDPIG